jgi:splicing factor 3A subunit 1
MCTANNNSLLTLCCPIPPLPQIDWHDFTVVETIDFYDDEDDELPPPMSLKELIAFNKQQAAAGGEQQEEEGAGDEDMAEVRMPRLLFVRQGVLGMDKLVLRGGYALKKQRATAGGEQQGKEAGG